MLVVNTDVKLPREAALAAMIIVANHAFSSRQFDAIITSGTEGVHSKGSEHYCGHALDWRVKHVPEDKWQEIRDQIANNLGPHFDVLLELNPPHIHIEWDPK